MQQQGWKWLTFEGVLMVSLCVSACGGGNSGTTPGNQQGTPAPSASPSPSPSQALYSRTGDAPVSGGMFSVMIVPERPTVEIDLEAVVTSGGPEMTIRWERNGKVVEDIATSRVSKGTFRRGDMASVIVSSAGREAKAEVKILNSPPRVKSVSFAPATIYRGADMTATPVVNDADGDEVRLRYQWYVNGEEVRSSDSPRLNGVKFRRGDQVWVQVTPFDGVEDGETYVSRRAVISNAPPVFVSPAPGPFEGDIYTYQAKAEDPDGDTVTYVLLGAPKGMSIGEKSGKVEWKLPADAGGDHIVEIVAKDPAGLETIMKYTLPLKMIQKTETVTEEKK